MGFFEWLGILVFLYYAINLILWIVLDSDIELFVKEKLGKSISSLQGKVIWITGASSGIGKQLAIVLAENNVKLCISARRIAELERVKEECLLKATKLQPNDILVLPMDMLDIDRHAEHFNKVIEHFGGVNVLVNNAGRSQRALFKDITLEVDRELFDLDVFSVINLSRIYVNHIAQHTLKGHIAITSSSVGLIIVPNSASYTAAKHALHGYFGSLKLEMYDQIDVTLFCPGPTSTEFLQNCFTNEPGKKYDHSVEPTDRRMTAQRCGFLMATAIANKTMINFVGNFPVSLLLYISCYYPNLRILIFKFLGQKGLAKIRDPSKKEH